VKSSGLDVAHRRYLSILPLVLTLVPPFLTLPPEGILLLEDLGLTHGFLSEWPLPIALATSFLRNQLGSPLLRIQTAYRMLDGAEYKGLVAYDL